MLQWNKGFGCRALVPHLSLIPHGVSPLKNLGLAQRPDSVVKKLPRVLRRDE
jgi:hypothetical protein